MSKSGFVLKSLGAVGGLMAFFMPARLLRWAEVPLNLTIPELQDLLAEDADFTVEALSGKLEDVTNLRFFSHKMEITYTERRVKGMGRVEVLHIQYVGKRGMEFTLVEGIMMKFQRLDPSVAFRPDLMPYDRSALQEFMLRVHDIASKVSRRQLRAA